MVYYYFFVVFSFILDGFRLSDYKIVKILQLILLIFILILILSVFNSGVIYAAGPSPEERAKLKNLASNSSVTINNSITIDKTGAEFIAKSINSTASQIELGASIAGVSTAVASLVKGTALPPAAKVGFVATGGIIGGAVHAGITNVSKLTATKISSDVKINPTELAKDTSSSVTESNFLDIHNSFKSGGSFNYNWISELLSNNPAEGLIYSIYGLNIMNIFLICLLSLILLSKYLSGLNLKKENTDDNNKLKVYMVKLLNLYSKTNNIYIILGIVLLFISLFFFQITF